MATYACWFTEDGPEASRDEIDALGATDAAEQYAAIHANAHEEVVAVTTRAPSGDERRFQVAIAMTYTAREIYR